MVKKFIKIFMIELLVIILIFLYFFVSNGKKASTKDTLSIPSDLINIKVDFKKSNLYMDLEEGLLESKEQIHIRDLSAINNPKEIFSILEDISNNNPEVMYYKGAEYRFGKLKLYYSKSGEDIKNHQEKVRMVKDDFISNYIMPNMSDYEKVLAIHDYIVETSRYDEGLLTVGEVPPESYSSYGVLALGIGVCEGYAKAMKYLLDEVGIESMLVVGESKGENHAWNLVKIEDEYYHLDSTWDDPITTDGSTILRYNYFNLEDKEMSISHTWNREVYPEAKGKKYNYFNYNNLVVLGKSELENKLRDALLKEKTNFLIKIINYNDINISINDILEKIAYENYDIIRLKGYSYSIDEEHGIIVFELYYN